MSNEMVTYKTDHGDVSLSSDTIKRYLVPSGANVTDQEIMMFMKLCEYQGLNPFLREVYLVKYGDSPASIVTGKETFTKRAMKNENYAGMEAGITVESDGKIIRRDGSMKIGNEKIIGGWAKVHVKGYSVPYYDEVSFDEYAGKKRDGTLNGMWATKPATMIRKVAIVHALREAFPQDFEGLYAPEEINTVDVALLPDKPVDITGEQPTIEPVKSFHTSMDVEPNSGEVMSEPSWTEKMKTATPISHVVEQTSVRPNADYIMVKAGVNHKLSGLKLCEVPEKTLYAIANAPIADDDKWRKQKLDTNDKINAFLKWKPTDVAIEEVINPPFDLGDY